VRRFAITFAWSLTAFVVACGGAQPRADCVPRRLSLPIEVHVEGAHAIDAEAVARAALEPMTRRPYTLAELTESEGRVREAIVRAYDTTSYATVTVGDPVTALDAARSHVSIALSVVEGEPHALGRVVIDDTGDLANGAGALVTGTPFTRSQIETAQNEMVAACREVGYPRCAVRVSYRLETESAPIDVTFRVERGAHATVDAIEVLDEVRGRIAVPRALTEIALGAPYVHSSVERARLALAALHPDREVTTHVDAIEDPAHVVVRFLLLVPASE
jgi:outer membrane protein assembly factor BamA